MSFYFSSSLEAVANIPVNTSQRERGPNRPLWTRSEWSRGTTTLSSTICLEIIRSDETTFGVPVMLNCPVQRKTPSEQKHHRLPQRELHWKLPVRQNKLPLSATFRCTPIELKIGPSGRAENGLMEPSCRNCPVRRKIPNGIKTSSSTPDEVLEKMGAVELFLMS
nr:uncharacterized protein LOC115262560 [Aedes albopictus]XP_029720821.1 uncharacterized protein LOC115262561 [Aedes albopictus]XP_029720822.1 uncharacterized protein LOC115262562 [Aedes albopictus]XP_029724637.1 uncharacterized protein LOC109403296 [Aedes albopictus]